MPTPELYDYAVIRVVPRVEREEFINVGVIVSCAAGRWLEARIELDAVRLRALDPTIDVDTVAIHLAVIPRVCAGGADAGPIGLLGARARFHWLTAKRSSIIQVSPVHSGRGREGAGVVERLMDRMVRLGR